MEDKIQPEGDVRSDEWCCSSDSDSDVDVSFASVSVAATVPLEPPFVGFTADDMKLSSKNLLQIQQVILSDERDLDRLEGVDALPLPVERDVQDSVPQHPLVDTEQVLFLCIMSF